jgi:hypothetical protein
MDREKKGGNRERLSANLRENFHAKEEEEKNIKIQKASKYV